MRSLLVFLIVVGSLPVILVKPHVGVWIWSWISYMNPHRISWGIADHLPLAQMVALTTIAGWILLREPKRLPMSNVTVLMVIYTAWICTTTLFAMNPDDAYGKWEQSMKILLMTFMCMALITTRDRLHILVWIIVVSIGFYGLRGGIFVIVTGGDFRVYGPERSFIADNNAIALALVMTVPLMRYLQLNTRRWYVAWGLYGAIGLTIVAILGTYSRGGLLAMAAMGTILILRSRRRLLILAVLAPAIVFAFKFMPEHWYDRMYSIEAYEQDGSARSRLRAWQFALNLAADHPITGGGFNAFWSHRLWKVYKPPETATQGLGKGAHSIYFEVLGEHGYVGLAIFLLLGASGVLMGSRIIRQTRGHPDLLWARDLASMAQVAIIGYAAAGTFQNLATFDLYYHLLAIMVITRHVVTESLAGASAGRPTRLGAGHAAPRGIEMT